MLTENFTANSPGQLVKAAQGYMAFVPNPLPPVLELSWDLVSHLSAAERAISQLAGVGRILPNPHLLIGTFVRREAVLSSRIEGTRASLSDLFFFEAEGERNHAQSDVQEVSNYVKAMDYGLSRLNDFPISLRLIREIHECLMAGVRGEHLTPGDFRRSQNWIGPAGCTLMDATYVPPPVDEMQRALGEFEKYLHADSELPLLVRLALIHYQFESIHPFLDGNGRVGRLLLTLLLCHHETLPQPLLYLSAFFERNRDDYYRLLLGVSQRGLWDEWVRYFLLGIEQQSKDAVKRAARLLELHQQYRDRLQSARASALLLSLIDDLFAHPVTTVSSAAESLGVTPRSARQ
ncbi:MAG: Fic family protein, partial [Blastocatellia bacterium]